MRFLIVDREPDDLNKEITLNLVRDAGGSVVEENCLGLIVECKPAVGRSLDLVEVIHLEEIVRIV